MGWVAWSGDSSIDGTPSVRIRTLMTAAVSKTEARSVRWNKATLEVTKPGQS